MKRDQNANRNLQSNPCLFSGILLNMMFQLARSLELEVLQEGWPLYLLCVLEGLSLSLMVIGLLMISPKRAEAIRTWKKNHLPFLMQG